MAFRADLKPFLAKFIEHHRGLRIGRMFGLPAGYAGRKLFVCLMADTEVKRAAAFTAQCPQVTVCLLHFEF